MAVLFPLLLLLATATRTVGAHERARGQRRRLAPSESIRRYLSEENENGEMQPKFSLSSVVDVDGEPDQYDVDVVQALPAVTARTTYSIRGGPHYPIGDLGVKFLVQDRSILDDDDGVNYAETKQTTFALIAVDENSGMIHGIAKKQGEKPMNIQQLNDDGALTAAMPADDFVPPKDFRCQATHREVRVDHSEQHHEHNNDETTQEHIFSEDDIDHLVAGHEHPTPQYSAQSEPETGFPSAPSHQVDLYIEIDQPFIELNGNNQTEAFKYVSALVTAASQIYEFELNTRLTVAHIEVTDQYENYTLAADVLERMVELYGDLNEWHYTDGNGVDLHHAILGQTLDGGIAYIETVCDSNYGFAVSPNMRGTFESLDFATVWDTSVLAHEVGHSFGAYHTHDYRPPVDRCYQRNSYATCPSESQLEDAATLMSYCDSCPGADPSSLAYTFGGHFVGQDPTNVDDWQNTQTLIGSYGW